MSTNKSNVNNDTIKESNKNNNTNVNKAYKDEIELRELIMILWNRKGLIIAITLILALLAGLVSKFLITPVYQTSFSIVAQIPENYNTKYGDYPLPIKTGVEYINLMKSNEVITRTIADMEYDPEEVTVESINSRISFEENIDPTQSIYQINVTGSTPQEATDLANSLYKNYTEFIDIMIKERAVNYYYNEYTVKYNQNKTDIDSNKDLLARHEQLLETVPKVVDPNSALTELPNSNGYIVLDNIVNPNYTELEFSILEIQQDINIMENENQEYSTYLEELQQERQYIDEYYESDGQGEFETNITDNLDIYRLSEPIPPAGKSSPNTTRNVVIAGILGAMVGVFAAFFMAYWKKEI